MQIQDSIKEVKAKTGQNIWIVFIPSFDVGEEDLNHDSQVDSQDWIQATADKSHFGDSDILLAVAISTHEMAVWISKDSNYLKSRSLDIITNGVMPYLRQAHYGQAVLKFNTSVMKQVQSSTDYLPYIIIAIIVTILVVFLLVNGVKRNAKADTLSFFEKIRNKKALKTQEVLKKTTLSESSAVSFIPDEVEDLVTLPSLQGAPATHISDTSEASNLMSAPMPAYAEEPVYLPSNTTPSNIAPASSQGFSQAGKYPPTTNSTATNTPKPDLSLPPKVKLTAPKIASTFFASDAMTSKNAPLDARSKTSSLLDRLDSLYDKYGVSKESAPASPVVEASDVKEIYGTYYKQSPSRGMYGSYYSDGAAAKHDAQVNKQLLEKGKYLTQKYSTQISTTAKKEDESKKVYDKYYKGNPKNSFKKRFGI